jgi:hypothetical protein
MTETVVACTALSSFVFGVVCTIAALFYKAGQSEGRISKAEDAIKDIRASYSNDLSRLLVNMDKLLLKVEDISNRTSNIEGQLESFKP